MICLGAWSVGIDRTAGTAVARVECDWRMTTNAEPPCPNSPADPLAPEVDADPPAADTKPLAPWWSLNGVGGAEEHATPNAAASAVKQQTTRTD